MDLAMSYFFVSLSQLFFLIYVYYKNIKNSIDSKRSGKANNKKKNDQINININMKETNKRPQSQSNTDNKAEQQTNDEIKKRPISNNKPKCETERNSLASIS